MSAYEKATGISPKVREALSTQAQAMSGDIAVNILRANVAPAPTGAIWSYEVPFELVDSQGRRHRWFSGDIAAAAADTSAGTASVSDATPAMVDGYGTVTLSGNAAAWNNGQTATLTLDGTVLGKTLVDATFVVTFTT